MNKKQKKVLARIIVSAALTATFELLPVGGWLKLAIFVGIYILIGYDILRKAFRGMLNRRVFDENFLMVVATLGAFSLAIYERSGDYTEAIAVMLLYQVGEFFQSYAVGKSRRNISQLMDIRPDYANLRMEDGSLEQVDPDEPVSFQHPGKCSHVAVAYRDFRTYLLEAYPSFRIDKAGYRDEQFHLVVRKRLRIAGADLRQEIRPPPPLPRSQS